MFKRIASSQNPALLGRLSSAAALALAFAVSASTTYLATDFASSATSDEGAAPPPLAPKSFLGRFLVSEIENRMERISGKKLEPQVRNFKAREIAAAIAEASYTYDVDPFLLLSMIEVESRYNHLAVGTVGELGLMQIKPSTALWISPKTDELHGCNLHEIRCNIMMGATYVSHLKARTEKRRQADASGTLKSSRAFREYVLRSYNLGPARTDRLAADRIESDRSPATDLVFTGQVQAPTSYAVKIARRANSFRSRYLVAAVPNPKLKDHKSLAARVPQATSTVAMIQ